MIVKRLIFFIVKILMIIHDCTCLPSHKLSANITKRQIVPMGCDYSSNCKYYEWCVRKKCEWACIDRMDCESWSTDGHCVALNNSGYCRFYSSTALSDLFDTSDPSEIKRGIKKAECSFNKDCDENAWCTVDKKCERACTSSRMNCESWSRDGYCDGERHIPVCRFHSAIETDPISDVSELRYGSKSQDTYCEHTYECSPDLYCHTNNKCINPCKELLKCTTDGPDNPGFVVLRDNEEYPESNKISCIIKDYVLSCE
ncbi:uncharacterized protein LOC111060315 isoform X3 [Nilaparvata lugens]|uniref:uncharacterized protein LOC111060315 isoform X1 n=1 Tax=Nilaparvata lugens TaxID=108931 RepID=UPI00193C9138|nr:uncharacterized protein LOC111060315 isoform X1 [Nilaparvata lugens]XP_039278378.1 uncharacterized protein LOC111060315 isoform X3 [Nilaparvata lugens]